VNKSSIKACSIQSLSSRARLQVMLFLFEIVFYPAYLALSCVCWLAIALTCLVASVFGGLVWLVCTAVKFFLYTKSFTNIVNTIEYALTTITLICVAKRMICRALFGPARPSRNNPAPTIPNYPRLEQPIPTRFTLLEPSSHTKNQVAKLARRDMHE